MYWKERQCLGHPVEWFSSTIVLKKTNLKELLGAGETGGT